VPAITAGRGTNAIENLTSACPVCKALKADRPLLGFLATYGYPVPRPWQGNETKRGEEAMTRTQRRTIGVVCGMAAVASLPFVSC